MTKYRNIYNKPLNNLLKGQVSIVIAMINEILRSVSIYMILFTVAAGIAVAFDLSIRYAVLIGFVCGLIGEGIVVAFDDPIIG